MEENGYEDYFERQLDVLRQRLEEAKKIVDIDRNQAENYQKKFKKFDEDYTKEYMNIAQNQN